MSTNYTNIPGSTGGVAGVDSINGISGAITLSPGDNITLTPVGNDIEISSTGVSGSGNVSQIAVFDSTNSIASSSAFTFDALNLNITGGIVAQNGGANFTIDVSSTTIAVFSLNGNVMFGDGNGLNVGSNLLVQGHFGVANTAAATTLGTVTRRLEIFDDSNNSLGFIPIYNSIT